METPEADLHADERHVRQVVARVRSALSHDVSDDEIEDCVRRTFDAWTDATVRDFIPLLTERRVLESLRG
jgi:hypothetical protein